MVRSKRISIVGGPGSGKTTLAAQLNSTLKGQGENSIFLEEYVVDYIGQNGPPSKLEHQMVIFDKQYGKERRFDSQKDFIICDSASWVSYIYGREYVKLPLEQSDIASLTHLYRKVQNTLNYWDYIFYVPMMDDYKLDGVRYNSREEAITLSNKIKTWLQIENVPFVDLTGVNLADRLSVVLDTVMEPKWEDL